MFADIILPVPFDSFTYLVPSAMEGRVMRGCRVVVPFGKGKIYTGVVCGTHGRCPEGVEVKEVMEVLDDGAVVNERQFEFWRWIARYYMCPMGDVMKAALPGAMKPKDGAALRAAVRKRRGGDGGGDDGRMVEETVGELSCLSGAQQVAFGEIVASFGEKDVTLLHGVTSSGKTEIYIHLIRRCIDEGKQVLYLLPEIALTTQITNRLRRVFGGMMGVYHSKFSERQRLDVYERQASAEPYALMLGVRSSIFLPFQNLGLVIVDEEHEQSYKQQEPAPRYHARSAAIMLARMFGAKTLLGTATPSFEVYHLAHKGRYGYVELKQRFRDMRLPTIEVVDTKVAKRRRLMRGVFSPRLIEVMGEALERKEQVILFQNRRGFSHFIECKECGWVARCPHCDVTLTLHRRSGNLSCHYCGYSALVPSRCPACEGEGFSTVGTGTEKVEDFIPSIFPGARTLRMDLDTAKTRLQHERIIDDFANRRADILIGTQMVTKGLDFDNVSVVGILDADLMLNLPDFRSYERAFQTLSQVAGRAGRRHRAGHVILQTRAAESDIVRQITANDYWQMFYTQMVERQMFLYPPFRRLIYVYLRHRDERLLDHLANEMGERLRRVFGERVLGPDSPLVARVHSLYIRKIMLKLEHGASIDRVREALFAVQEQMMEQPIAKGVNIFYDVDPM